MKTQRFALTRIPAITLGLALAFTTTASHGESLMEIYNLAIGNDPQFKAAEANLAAARETMPQSTANFLPSLSANASHNEYIDPDNDSSQSYGLTLVQPIYQHGSFVQRRTAKSVVSQAEAEFFAAEQGLILDVASAYFSVLSAQDNLEFAEAEKQANARQLEQTRQRFDVGLVAITDVHESQAAYDISVAQSIAAANDLDSARESLHEITNHYHETLAALGDKLPLLTPEPADLKSWTELALKQNPALKATEQATVQAREAINAQRSNDFPTLDLIVNHSDTSSDDPQITGSTDYTTATLQLSMALYEGGRTRANVRQAREYLKSSQQLLEKTKRETQRNVRNAYRGVISGISRVKALKQALVSNQSALRAAEAGYEVGTRTTVDVLVARRNLFAAQRDYAQSRYDYLLNTLRLQEAAGSLSVEDLRTVNSWLH